MGRKRYKGKKINYNKLTPIEVYEFLLNGYICKFPDGFVDKESMKEIIREVILNRQKFSREDICKKLNYKYLAKHKLSGSKRTFNNDTFELITYCFPEFDIKNWELNKVRKGFWEQENNRKEYMNWLIKKEKIDPSKISDLRKITSDLIDENFGSKARTASNGVFNLILLISKVKVKEWEVINISKWNDEKALEAIKWLIEEKLKWSDQDIVEKMNAKVFYENNLGGLIKIYFNHNVIKALNFAYPGKFIRNSSYKIELA